MADLEKIFLDIIAGNTEDMVAEEIDAAKGEYVWDWEGEFDTLDEAYAEQGRGEAESLVIRNLINANGGKDLDPDSSDILFGRVKDHYNLNTD
jgi:hypothetical protein